MCAFADLSAIFYMGADCWIYVYMSVCTCGHYNDKLKFRFLMRVFHYFHYYYYYILYMDVQILLNNISHILYIRLLFEVKFGN